MKIVVFGASGRTGANIVEQALRRGYGVTAFIHKARGPMRVEKLRSVEGDALNLGDVEKAVAGQDAVLSALGRGSSPGPVTFPGTKNIMDAMEKHGVKRLIVESAFGAGDSAKEMSLLDRLFIRGILLRSAYRDKDLMEEYVEKSSLKWTIVRPSRLTDGTRKGIYRAGERIPLNVASGISRADVADFMLKQVQAEDFVRKKPSVGP
jgi:putative NADH-flavin reductase